MGLSSEHLKNVLENGREHETSPGLEIRTQLGQGISRRGARAQDVCGAVDVVLPCLGIPAIAATATLGDAHLIPGEKTLRHVGV